MKFKIWLENQGIKEISITIPLPNSIFLIRNILKKYKYQLYVVGGAVRDFLRGEKPKDVDVCTDAPPKKVGQILTQAGISNFPKGEAFGVWVAHIDGEDYEIATFREDIGSTDGRHPDYVNFSDIATDYKRRDLTINALYYEIPDKPDMPGKIIDHGGGQGIEDVKNGIARPVGSAKDRFKEDKLRIPRLVRFFSRFNPGHILQHLDQDVIEAIKEFKDLAGVSPERIADEFTKGLAKAASPINYLKNYEAVGLIPAVFPSLQVDMQNVNRIGNNRNIKAILAWLLKDNNPQTVRLQLNRAKYPNDVTDEVGFLVKLFHFDIARVANLLTHRDLYKQLDPALQVTAKATLERDILDFAKISGKESELQHFLAYQPTVNSKDFMHLKGKAIGDAINGAEAASYQRSLNGQNMARRSEKSKSPKYPNDIWG